MLRRYGTAMTSDGVLSATPRTRLGRHSERGLTDRSELYAVLDAGRICHLGVTIGGSPVVLPTAYGRRDATLYLHGSSASRSIRAAVGQEVCVTVTHLDGLVCARSVFNHSMNYRSAVVFATARLVSDPDERLTALRVITEHLVPGRWDAVRPPNRKELAATSVLAVPLDEASVKVRSGPPADEPADVAAGTWAGVIPVTQVFGAAVPDPDVPSGVPAPEHIAALTGGGA